MKARLLLPGLLALACARGGDSAAPPIETAEPTVVEDTELQSFEVTGTVYDSDGATVAEASVLVEV